MLPEKFGILQTSRKEKFASHFEAQAVGVEREGCVAFLGE